MSSHLLKTAFSQPQKCLRPCSLWLTADCTAFDNNLMFLSWKYIKKIKKTSALLSDLNEKKVKVNQINNRTCNRGGADRINLTCRPTEQVVYIWETSIAFNLWPCDAIDTYRPIGWARLRTSVRRTFVLLGVQVKSAGWAFHGGKKRGKDKQNSASVFIWQLYNEEATLRCF